MYIKTYFEAETWTLRSIFLHKRRESILWITVSDLVQFKQQSAIILHYVKSLFDNISEYLSVNKFFLYFF